MSHSARVLVSALSIALFCGVGSVVDSGASFAAEPAPQNRPLSVINEIDWPGLLPAPPTAGTPEQAEDVDAVLAMQKRFPQGSARSQLAEADAESSCYRFADVLGDKFNQASLPLTTAFLRFANRQSGRASTIVKNYWMRPRPYIVNGNIVALGDNNAARRRARGDAQHEIDNTSYPSGHSTFGTTCGLMLSRLVPEKKNELFARAETYRQSRVVIGVHFPTDIEAGRLLATAVAAVVSQTPEFQQQEMAARTELRAALGLPAELPKQK